MATEPPPTPPHGDFPLAVLRGVGASEPSRERSDLERPLVNDRGTRLGQWESRKRRHDATRNDGHRKRRNNRQRDDDDDDDDNNHHSAALAHLTADATSLTAAAPLPQQSNRRLSSHLVAPPDDPVSQNRSSPETRAFVGS